MKHGKQIFLLLLAWVLLLYAPVSVAASSTELKTTVPSHSSLTIEVSGKGTVRIGSHRIRKEQTLSLPRNDQTEISLRPDRGYEVESILFDGTDITSQMKDGTLTLDLTGAEHTLSVTFVRSESSCPKPDLPPETEPGITSPIKWWIRTVKEFLRWIIRRP